MLKYFDRTFWKMSLGFLLLILAGLAGIYLINWIDNTDGPIILEIKP